MSSIELAEDIDQVIEEVVGSYDGMGLEWTSERLAKWMRKWALQMVGEDDPENSPEANSSWNELRAQIRHRIEESTSLNQNEQEVIGTATTKSRPENFRKPEWEEEFDQVFGTNLWREHRYQVEYKGEQAQWVTCAEEVKAFIRKTISKSVPKLTDMKGVSVQDA